VQPERRLAVAIAAISEDGRFLAYFVRQGGTEHSVVEIFGCRAECSPFLIGSQKDFALELPLLKTVGVLLFASQIRRRTPEPSGCVLALLWRRSIRGSGDVPCQRRAEPIPRIIHSVEAKLLAYVVFSTGKVRYTSIYLQEMTPGADKASSFSKASKAPLYHFCRGAIIGLHGFCRPKLSYRPY